MTKMSYQRWFVPLATPLGLGPKRSEVRIRDGALHVAMGWGFSAAIPVTSIKNARRFHDRVFAWGVHGFRGRWLVNGSSQGIVELTIDPPVRARILAVPMTLRELLVSVTDPDELIAACSRD